MLKKSFKLKIIIPTIFIFVVLVIIVNVFLSIRFSAINSDLISEKLIANTNSLNLFLETSMSNSRAAAISTARYPDVVDATKTQDRDKLLRIFTPMHDTYGVNYFTITDIDGKVLVRTHEPENHSDYISYQQNIKDAMDGKISSYFESGTVVKVSVRTGAPIYDEDGTMVGIVSAGVRFDTDSTVRELKDLLNAEVTIFLGDTRIATTITKDGHSIEGTTLDDQLTDIIIGTKREYSGEAEVLGEKYVTFYKPLFNAQGEVFAIFFTGTPVDDLIARSNKTIRDGIILGLVGLAGSILLLYFIITIISMPITVLSHNMTHIANGNLAVDIDVKNEDEIGVLGKSLQRIADILHKLLDEIKNMITEHEKGNIEHCLNAEEFNGGYKTLAKDILALATVSTTDQLTGVPNRRSLDNRLDMEWNRAKREKTPLSILMMDLDGFKLYNDTFGHQQGDLALQTLAATITHSLKRSTDFFARWGGEEFSALLPVTDSTQAKKVAERLRAEVEKTVIPCVDERADKVTISIGANTLIPTSECTIEAFISAADVALYKAKESGRNAVYAAGECNEAV